MLINLISRLAAGSFTDSLMEAMVEITLGALLVKGWAKRHIWEHELVRAVRRAMCSYYTELHEKL